MAQIQTHNNQTWFDISVWIYGTSEYAFDLALQNNSSITEDVPAGTMVEIPDFTKNHLTLVSLKTIPATGFNIQDLGFGNQGKGIGYMKVGSTFKVG